MLPTRSLAALVLCSSAALADSKTFTNGCMDGKVFDAGLCYPHCKDGYKGVGPVCWSACSDGYHDDGATCRKTLTTSARASYGRGVGHVLSCAPGQDLDGGLCYPDCKSGYHGTGPVCWETCAKGKHDFGAFCGTHAKKSYGRGAGHAVSACPAGSEKSGALCYANCKAGYSGTGPVCWQNCAAGMTSAGAFCAKGGEVAAKKSYGRGVGTIPPVCTASSFAHEAPADGGPREFTLLFASDTQLTWWRGGHDATCGPPHCDAGKGDCGACVDDKGKQTNREQLQAMNAIESLALPGGKKPTAPQGLVLNGDLTAYWHDTQADLFEAYYNNKESLRWPLYPGLGNHDYSNNNSETGGKDQGCWWTRDADKDFALGAFGCANNSTNWMRAAIACNKVPALPVNRVQSFDLGSLGYSWNIGKWHFVQLHNHPTFKVDKIGLKSSIAWLKTDLAAATKAGRNIVLDMHDWWTDASDAGFADALKGARVVAAFAGHTHERWGRVSTATQGFPVYLDGASEYQTFLVAAFSDDHLTVTAVSSKGGKPSLAPADDSGDAPADSIAVAK